MSVDKTQIVAMLEKLLTGPAGLDDVRHAIDDLTTRLEVIETERPVKHVQINDLPVVELSGRVHPAFERTLKLARAGLYPFLVGPAGCGKTSLGAQVAEALKLPFYFVNLTQGASETWLFGRQTPTGFVEGPFAQAYRTGGVFLCDEIDSGDPNLLLAINTALSHPMMLNPMSGERFPRHKDFLFIAAGNTNGKGATHKFVGRARLDDATLDRLTVENVTYDTDLERELCPIKPMYEYLTKVRAVLSAEKIDDTLSTRAFVSAYKQLCLGFSFNQIVTSLVANWSAAGAKVAWAYDAVYFNLSEEEEEKSDSTDAPVVKRGRGRPRKDAVVLASNDDFEKVEGE